MRAIILALVASLGAIGALIMPTTAAQQAGAEVQERARLLQLQRVAVTQLQQASRADVPADQVRRALLDASRSLEALSAGPDPGSANATTEELLNSARPLYAVISVGAGNTFGLPRNEILLAWLQQKPVSTVPISMEQ